MSNMVVRTNTLALNSHRNLGMTGAAQARSSARLSSGFRINSAADDAAGLGISETMRAQIRGLNQASRNAQDGISLIQTAEGALGTVNEMVSRIRELVVQSGNDTNTDADRGRIQDEVDQLIEEINEVSVRTEFNTMNLLGGSGVPSGMTGVLDSFALSSFDPAVDDINQIMRALGTIERHLNLDRGTAVIAEWTESGSHITELIDFGAQQDMDTLHDQTNLVGLLETATGLTWTDPAAITTADEARANARILEAASNLFNAIENGGSELSFNFQIGANSDQQITVDIDSMSWDSISGSLSIDLVAVGHEIDSILDRLDDTLGTVTAQRSELGAVQNRLEFTIENLDIASENLSAAESRIRDADMAAEMMRLTQSNVLQQAATSMLAQANQAPQSILQLLG